MYIPIWLSIAIGILALPGALIGLVGIYLFVEAFINDHRNFP